MRKKHFKVLKWPKCCVSIGEYPLNSLQKMEEMSNSESSDLPTSLGKLYENTWAQHSSKLCRRQKYFLAIRVSPGSLTISTLGRDRVSRGLPTESGKYRKSCNNFFRWFSAPQVWKPVKAAFQWCHCCFEMLRKKKYFPPHFFPRWLVRKSSCFLPCAQSHLAYFCCVEICNNKTGRYWSHILMTLT